MEEEEAAAVGEAPAGEPAEAAADTTEEPAVPEPALVADAAPAEQPSAEGGDVDAAQEAAVAALLKEDDEEDEEEEDGERPKSSKTLEQMMSLKEGDDERTQISKKVSWILRHGARKVSIEIDEDGWVTIPDLLNHHIMTGVSEERLMDLIAESNAQKVRYEIRDADGDIAQAIRAVSKHTISGMAGTLAREQRRAEKEQRREARQEHKERQERGEPDPGPGSGDAGKGGDNTDGASQGWNRRERTADDDEGPTFEQQLQDGYRPVYQNQRLIAMVKEGNLAVKPGRRTKGDYKGEYKGEYKGKGDSKGYGKDRDGGGYGGYRGGYGGKGDDDRGDFHYSKGKGGGKGSYRDYQDHGGKSGGRDYGNYGGKGFNSQYEQPHKGRPYNAEPMQQRWRVCDGQEAIMRASEAMESQAILTLPAGSVVLQTGDYIANQHGIIRMPVESEDGTRGWVTRTAKAANGPDFFRLLDSGDRGGGKSYDGGHSYGGGKGSKGGKKGKNDGKGKYGY